MKNATNYTFSLTIILYHLIFKLTYLPGVEGVPGAPPCGERPLLFKYA